jgi:glucose/arabinose dehydrogenase
MRNGIERLIFIDANVSDIHTLMLGAAADTTVILLGPEPDGLSQISAHLAAWTGIQSLHIVSHGAPGCLFVADRTIDMATLTAAAPQLAAWQQSVTPDASIWLYGCEVGAGAVGQAFVNQLHQLTGMPVAASDTITGNAHLGGDWQFAVRTGNIPTALAFSAQAQRQYSGVLANTTFNINNFGQAQALWVNGDASFAGNSLLLTADKTFQQSSGYYLAPMQIDGAVSFQTKFQFRLGGTSGTFGSDGFTFVFQNADAGATALGAIGGNVGYGGIDRSFAIKFDTFQNAGIDRSDNSIALIQNGQIANAIATTVAPFDLNSGELLTAWVEYDGLSNQMNVFLGNSDTKPGVAVLSANIDIAALLGKQAYVGFTAGSGSLASKQEILTWDFTSSSVRANDAPPTSQLADISLANLNTNVLSFNGGAARVGNSLQLTPDRILQRGSSFYATPFQVLDSTSFNSQFQFKLDGAQGTNGADGFTFVLQNSGAGTNALGTVGSGTGLWGIDRSLAIKFDTYQNPGDLGPNTISLIQNGDITNPLLTQAVPFDLNNGSSYNAWVEYDGFTNQINVYLSTGTTKPATPVLSQIVDLSAIVGNQAYAGFTASTGAVGNRQTIEQWNFNTSIAIGNGDGLRAEYFDNADFTNLKYVEIDPTVNFDWGAGAPSLNLQADNFAVRWFGQVQSLYNETYTFYTTTNDGARLKVNGQLLVDGLVGAPGERSGTIALEAGKKYTIELEYVEGTGDASAQLSWSSATQQRQIIPQSQLFSGPYTPGTILMGSENFSVQENAGTAKVRFDRIDGSDGYATVTYTIANNTAQSGTDFVGGLNTVTFKPGEITKTVDVALINDTVLEATEQFGVSLGQTAGAGLGTRRTVGVTILDDDAGTSIFDLEQAAYQVGENAGTAKITIQRSGDTTIAASVGYTLTGVTAIVGTDFVGGNGVVNFAANETTKTFDVTILDNLLPEPNKTLNVVLNNPTSGILGTQTTAAVVTIQDNDTASKLVREDFINGLVQPSAFEFAPGSNLMFVAEKRGTVQVFENGAAKGTFIDISNEVNSARDRGLIGIAIHPQFFTGSPYIYLSYTYDPPEAAIKDQANNRPSRVIRVTADAAADYTRVLAGSAVVILGKNSTWANTSGPNLNSTTDVSPTNDPFYQPVNPPSGRNADGTWIEDYLATDSESHSIGDVAFGPDGALYVSNGDGTSYSAVDARTYRVQDINNLSGKLLRIDPLTGAGLPDNPFYNGANPNSNASKVWNLGLRNPFRFTFNPTTGDAIVGDVGWFSYEEINVGGGKNFGWPYFEGSVRTTGYNQRPESQQFYASGQQTTAPAYAYVHAGQSNAIVVGDFYRGPVQAYQNGLFIADVAAGTIKVEFFNDAGTQVDQAKEISLANNFYGVVQMISGPDGSMYYASIGGEEGGGAIGRWVAAA